MTTHVFKKNIDPDFLATLSPEFVKILREMGFVGVIVSDEIHIGAILDHYEFEKVVVLAVKARIGLLIISNNSRNYDPEVFRYNKNDLVEY